MNRMPAEQFTVDLTPLPTAARVATHRRALRWRIISALISLAVLIVVFFIVRPGWSSTWAIVVVVLWAISTGVWIGVTAWSLARAKRDLASIDHGTALAVTRQGMEFYHPTTEQADWSRISAVKISGSGFGAGPDLVMEVDGAPAAKVPMSFLDAMPSAIDSAVTAHSLGRVRLDVSDMDNIL